MMVRISASILDCDFLHLAQELQAVVNAGIDALHLDIMDGHFVPNLSFGVPIARAVRKEVRLPIYAHLMVEGPEPFIDKFLPYADYIIFHIEATERPEECIKAIALGGCRPGISLNPNTPIEKIEGYLSQIDDVLVMSVYPGFGGQDFIPSSLERIARIKQIREQNNLNYTISVDGGVSPANAERIIQAGADILVAGSAIFKSKNYSQTVQELRCLKP
ncbi:MAG: ribulose-phosphate 3-epimerase [candidate division WOR-3 bacterium]